MKVLVTLIAVLAQQQLSPAQLTVAIITAIGQMQQTIERLTQENEQLKKELKEKGDAQQQSKPSPPDGGSGSRP